ncbi:MAG: diaminopimelate epimerase [Nitrososphaerota archaeon]|nr:diaminopimelate epimerase [Candidatus Bathyarchaeota archaeon]MDW8022284.1 diaminopimelate epimerase [Nitrososphaerota archaeon]
MVKGLKFWKMHGLGNDYIVIDNTDGKLQGHNIGELAKNLCQRRFSVGADGLILACKSNVADVKMRIFNPDGTEAEMCGNGIRCLAKYCYENNIVKKKTFNVETLAGIRQVWLTANGEVEAIKVDMGKPTFERKVIPMTGDGKCINEELEVEGNVYRVTCLSTGNPHCVIFVDDVASIPLEKIGPKIENHKVFPKRINVEFAQVLSPNEIKVRVWERGVGETLACGTGACASVVSGYVLGKTERKVKVHLLGGSLEVFYNGRIYMEGPATKVFVGELL